jgi:hypothetical protein
MTERHCVPPLVVDTVFDQKNKKYQKHTFAHTYFIHIQVTVLYK